MKLPEGGTIRYVYDSADRSACRMEEGRDYQFTEYRHDFRGSLTDRRDTLGREKSRINGEGETEYSLDYDAIGRVTARTDGEGNTTRYEYHPTGKVANVSGPDGAVDYHAEYDILGRLISATDGNGNVTQYRHDKWGRVTDVILPDGGTEHYEYDYAGNVVSATDAMGKETRFTYRAAGRVESIRRADGSERYFGYDAEGRCSCRLDENKNLIRTTYNMDGNPVLMTGSRNAGIRDAMEDNRQNAGPEIRSVYTYDERGSLTSASEGGTVYHYTRDSEGRILTKSAWGKTLYEDSYDRDGRLQGSSDGRTRISYSYDRAGRLTHVSSDSGAGAEYHYDRNGSQTQVLYANGMRTSYCYDSRNRMTGMETMLPGGELLYRSACIYDRAGNRTGREEQYRDAFSGPLHTAVTTYTYDGMGRLTGEELDGKLTGYSYDMAGNRLSRTTEGRTERYHYNSRSQLTGLDSAAETVQYEYDHAGNLTAESHIPQGGSAAERTGYTYDAYNRNISVCGAGYVQQNHYDAEGLRYAVTENGSTTNFVYRNGMLSSELDADRNPARGYVYGNEYISQNNGSSFSYYLDDEQGSIRYLTGSDGSIRNHYRYSAFGESITAEETVPNRLKYNAQMADELTGLYYLRARYYNASLGRFTQEDTIYNDGLNLYAYCNSNPVMYCDPSGFAKETCKSKVGGECDSESSTYSLLPGEGDIGTYKDLVKAGKRGDNITPHHMPSAEYMGTKGVARNDGLCMNMEMPSPGTGGRHRLTDTYGRNMTDTKKAYYYSLSPRDALAYDIKNLREIYQSQGLYSEIRPQLRKYIKKYKDLMPKLFEK